MLSSATSHPFSRLRARKAAEHVLPKAFTLIELLVVVAIIALLIAILIPSLSKAREVSRRAKCLANARGMAQSFHLYMADTSSLIPRTSWDTWANAFSPYGNSEKIRHCPDATDDNPILGSTGTALKLWNQVSGSVVGATYAATSHQTGAYAFNGWLYGPPLPPPNTTGDEDSITNDSDDIGMSFMPTGIPAPPDTAPSYASPFYYRQFNIDMANPAVVPVFADGTWLDSWPLEADPVPSDLILGSGNSPGDNMGRICIARHRKSVNVSFLDSHAENVKLPQLWTFEWHVYWQNPNPLPIIP